MIEEKPQIDTNALSRQLAVYGHEAQGKLMALKVFIYGLNGVHIFLCSSVSKSQRTWFWLVPSKWLFTTPACWLSATSARTFMLTKIRSGRWHVPKPHCHIWKNWTPVSLWMLLLMSTSRICMPFLNQCRQLLMRCCPWQLWQRIPYQVQ